MHVTCPAHYFPFYHPNVIQLGVKSCSWKQHYLYHITTWTPPSQLVPRKVNNDTHTNVNSPATPKAIQNWLQQSNDICTYRSTAHGWKSQHTFRPDHTTENHSTPLGLLHTAKNHSTPLGLLHAPENPSTPLGLLHTTENRSTPLGLLDTAENHIALKNRELSMHSDS